MHCFIGNYVVNIDPTYLKKEIRCWVASEDVITVLITLPVVVHGSPVFKPCFQRVFSNDPGRILSSNGAHSMLQHGTTGWAGLFQWKSHQPLKSISKNCPAILSGDQMLLQCYFYRKWYTNIKWTNTYRQAPAATSAGISILSSFCWSVLWSLLVWGRSRKLLTVSWSSKDKFIDTRTKIMVGVMP